MKKKIFKLGFISIMALFGGIIIEIFLINEDKSFMLYSLQKTIDNYDINNFNFARTLFSFLLKSIIPILIIYLSSFSKFLFLMPYLVIFHKSFSIGFTSSFLFENFSSYGMANIAFIILPQSLLEVPVYIFLATLALSQQEFNTTSYRQAKSMKIRYLKLFSLGIISLFIIFIIETLFLNINYYIKTFI